MGQICTNNGKLLQKLASATERYLICALYQDPMQHSHLFELPDTSTFSRIIGELTVSFRRVRSPFTLETGYIIIISSNDSSPSTFSMKKTGTDWQIKDKNMTLLFGHLQTQLNDFIFQHEAAF